MDFQSVRPQPVVTAFYVGYNKKRYYLPTDEAAFPLKPEENRL
jgi:hypothetical protein